MLHAPSHTQPRTHADWQLRTRTLALGPRTLICGILNVTPDSFSDGGRYLAPDAAVAHAIQMLDEGADLIDIGAESTRPGSLAGEPCAISTDEEQSRLLPVIEAILRERPDAILSIDTYKAATARAALAAGAEIINDVSGLSWDNQMAATCSELRPGLILMHTRGVPGSWSTLPPLTPEQVLPTVADGLTAAILRARTAGIAENTLALDPGFGFGKRLGENYPLLAHQAELLLFGLPLFIGLSRKSFLRNSLTTLNPSHVVTETDLDAATSAAHVAAILHGASILRTHAIRPARQAAAIADAILASY